MTRKVQSPHLTPREQLAIITEGRIRQAVEKYLGGDWSRRQELFTISLAEFHAWVDSVPLPRGGVHNKPQASDGIYVLKERGRWVVFYQERGGRQFELGDFDDYRLAKREALAAEYLIDVKLRKE